MGVCAALFYSSEPDNQTLHRRVRPSDDQLDSQQAYWTDLVDFLKPELNLETGLPITHWLQGSYKFGTQIRPSAKGQQFDIDLGVYLTVSSLDHPPYTSLEVKRLIQRKLGEYALSPDTDALHVEPVKEFCSRIVFSEDFHIDVPAYIERKHDVLLASESSGYTNSNPWKLYDWWVGAFDSDAQRDRARRVVRYLKMWAALKFSAEEKPPSSIMITICVANAFSRLNETFVSGDDELLAAVIQQIINDLDESGGVVSNPVSPEENLNRLGADYAVFRSRLQGLNDKAVEALDPDTVEVAADRWAAIFEHFFPLPDEMVVLESASPLELARGDKVMPEVLVEVTLPTGKIVTYKNSALNLPKGSQVRFRLENYAGLPDQSQVIWTVRNEGAQAEAVNDLGHFSGRGENVGPESADYHGRHFMDVVIRRKGQTIGMRRIPVSVLNMNLSAKARRLFSRKR